MQNALYLLSPGKFADLSGDWRVHVVQSDPRHAGVFYIGSYPYDVEGNPLHPEAPEILSVWDAGATGARQISERQKRIAHLTTTTVVEPVFALRHA